MPIYLIGVPLRGTSSCSPRRGLTERRRRRSTSCSAPAEAEGEGHHARSAWATRTATPATGSSPSSASSSLDDIGELKTPCSARPSSPTRSTRASTRMEKLRTRAASTTTSPRSTSTRAGSSFPRKKAAMAWTTDGNALAWAKQLGARTIGVSHTPKLGSGSSPTPTHHAVLERVHHLLVGPQEGCGAPSWPGSTSRAQLKAWYDATGVFPADKRFAGEQHHRPDRQASCSSWPSSPRSGRRTTCRRRSTRTRTCPPGRRSPPAPARRRRPGTVGPGDPAVEDPAPRTSSSTTSSGPTGSRARRRGTRP